MSRLKTNTNKAIETLLKDAFKFLQNEAWDNAEEYCNKALEIDPNMAEAHLGKLLSELQCKTIEDLQFCESFNIIMSENTKKLRECMFNDDASDDPSHPGNSVQRFCDIALFREVSEDVIEYETVQGDAGDEYVIIACKEEQRDTLTSLTCLENVPLREIKDNAFEYCMELTEVAIPRGITSIGKSVFSFCIKLADVKIPDSLKCIGDFAFWNCSDLVNITIPNSVESIGGHAFEGTALEEITIPKSVTSIGQGAFGACGSLERIFVEEGNPVYYSEGNCLIEKESKALVFGCKNSIIPDDVTAISAYAFQGTHDLTSIFIPESVTSIGNSAFMDCTSLEGIIIPEGVRGIEHLTFSGCSSLSHIILPQSIQSIDIGAFTNCTSLEKISIPDSVTDIADDAFEGCINLNLKTVTDDINDFEESRISHLSIQSVQEGEKEEIIQGAPEHKKTPSSNSFIGKLKSIWNFIKS